MAHGTKDYGNVSPKETTYRLDDMAELAVRLGALPSLDRLGDIIYQEDFSHGIYNWTQLLEGVGASISLDTTHFKSSGFSAKLVAGSTAAKVAQIRMYFPYPVLSNFGLESCMTIGTDIESLIIGLSLSSGGTFYQGAIKIDPINDKIYYFSSAGAWVELVSSIDFYVDDYIYNNFKLVIDLTNIKYKRFCYNNGVKNMSGLDLYSIFVGDPDSVVVDFAAYSKAGLNGISYLDNIIVTQNEP